MPVDSLEPIDDDPIIVESLPATYINQFIGDGDDGSEDRDRYQIPIDGPSIVTAVVTPTQLALLDPVVNGVYENTQPDVRIAKARYVVHEGPTTEIVVAGKIGASNYLGTRSFGFYNITIDVTPIAGGPIDGPLEPDDSLLQATIVGLEGPGVAKFSAFIGDGRYGGSRGDTDYYELTIRNNETLTIDVEPTGGSPLSAQVRMYSYLGRAEKTWVPDISGAVHVAYKPPPLAEPVTYIFSVAGAGDRPPIDPIHPKAEPDTNSHPDSFIHADQAYDGGPGSTGDYQITLMISSASPQPQPPLDARFNPPLEDLIAVGETEFVGPQPYFTIPLDDFADRIVEIDPTDASERASLTPPEVPLSNVTGLASDNGDLFMLGTTGRFPKLYKLDAASGEVLQTMTTWFGSGRYGDLAVLGDVIYMVDVLGDAIYAMPKTLDGPVSKLDLGGLGGFTLAGGIAAGGSPGRLYVPEAPGMSNVIVLDAINGQPMDAFALRADCPCRGDVDDDGDVDDTDLDLLLTCKEIEGFPVLDCVRADMNCDDVVDDDDIILLICQHNEPGNEPHEGCCPTDLPIRPMRATSLTGQFPNNLIAGDWMTPELQRFDPEGQYVDTLILDNPVSAVAGVAFSTFVNGDANDDGRVDLRDWAALQVCLRSDGPAPPLSTCSVFDNNLDDTVDLDDYASIYILWEAGNP